MAEAAETVVIVATFIISLLSFLTVQRYSTRMITASFTFWSQFRLMVIQMHKYLTSDKTLINNLYSPEAIRNWDDKPPSDKELKEFYEIIVKTMKYLEKMPDQLPAYKGWSDDMNIIQAFLSDVKLCDIKDPKGRFIFDENSSKKERDEYVMNICEAMKSMETGIIKEQERIEKKLFFFRK